MKSKLYLPSLILLLILIFTISLVLIRKSNSGRLENEIAQYSGSESCRPCHEKFYQLWHDSFHGLAMQPVTGDFIKRNIHSFDQEIRVGTEVFQVSARGDSLIFTEKERSGINTDYPAVHAMGGKYIYYFLTPLAGGRLQVLPLAYDCDTRNWYNNPESGVRHFETIEDAPLDWMSHLYTFNTTCYNCHVSQMETNYNPEDNTYNTTWREPGINCETCHGPSYEHIVECIKAGEEKLPDDLKIVQTSVYTPAQHNAACGSCHAKARVIAGSFEPGGRFYDYFDLVTIENPDFYADGRDLGENYTMTTWEMNTCAERSGMHCVSCHTSSGRYRFTGEKANDACMPCHSDKVSDVSAHSFHKPGSEGSKCISCHMPKTTFARMDRSDHSFRPPMPQTTIAFGSPNACNICHDRESAEWAEKEIKKTHRREYQQKELENGYLIRKAREGDWSDLDIILSGLESGQFNKIYTTSFIRLLENCSDPAKWELMLKLTTHESPLVRGAAAHSLYASDSDRAFDRLTELVEDDYRVVRINAAFALSSFPEKYFNEQNSIKISGALKEYENSLITHPDDWSAHYNLGNFYSNLNDFERALDAYETSMRIFPGAIMPMVNAGFIYSMQGNYSKAEEMFTQALSYEPDHEAALLNLALLYGEAGKKELAKQYFKRLMVVSDKNSVAAYNLAVLEAGEDWEKALELSRQAMEWEPGNHKYAYTHAFYLLKSGNTARAKSILEALTYGDTTSFDASYLLSGILINEGKPLEARDILNKVLAGENLDSDQKEAVLIRLKLLEEAK
ncbi:MAG: ammonia-forming cytochrome c nitrite reductase subunit c552 [Bacteroidales bacterium]|nr:ammonia-forming cytochrome c nitrite reductase subunit c552 [Bacteroidales bacterium]